MFTRRTVMCAIVCALMTTALAVSPAGASERTRTVAPQAQYYASFGAPGAVDPGAASADHGRYFPHGATAAVKPSWSAVAAQARYYASFGQPQPLTQAHQPAPADDDTPWLPIALIAAAALALIAAGVILASRMRRHTARVAA